MTLFRGSRYSGANVIPIEVDKVNRSFVYYRKALSVNDVDADQLFEHVVQQGDTFQNLAFRFGGDDSKWHIIAEINDWIACPLEDIPLGTKLLIPTPDVFVDL